MKPRETTKCPNCESVAEQVARQGVEIADLKAQPAAALDRIDKLQQENARLRNDNEQLKQQLAAARKNSSTSSKPPSSDIVKPKKPRGKDGKKRKRGGQPGHKRHERPEFPPGMIDEFICHTLDSCPDCGGGLLFSRKADGFSSSCSNRSNLTFAVFPPLRSCRQAPDGFSSLSRLRLSP